jgi:hypothetical protein
LLTAKLIRNPFSHSANYISTSHDPSLKVQMVDGNLFIPLSPPRSPPMSAYSTTPAENDWQNTDIKGLDPSSAHSDGDMALLQAEVTGHNFDLKRPLLRTHKSFPYTLDNKHHQSNGSDSPSRDRIGISSIDDIDSNDMPTVTFGGSAPASPVSRLTPPSPNDGLNGDKNDPQGDEIITEEMDDGSGDASKDEEKPPISAAELRAQKRKMKRFRYDFASAIDRESRLLTTETGLLTTKRDS